MRRRDHGTGGALKSARDGHEGHYQFSSPDEQNANEEGCQTNAIMYLGTLTGGPGIPALVCSSVKSLKKKMGRGRG